MELIYGGRMTGEYLFGAAEGLVYGGALFDPPSGLVITALLSRYASEIIGTYQEASLTREVAEVLMAPELQRGVMTRAVLEVMQLQPAQYVTVAREVVEVVQEMGFALPVPRAELVRAVAEVIGTAADYVGRRITSSRALVEAIGSITRRSRGLTFPKLTLPAFTVAAMVELEDVPAGEFTIADGPGRGLSIAWGGGNMQVLASDTDAMLAGVIPLPTEPFRVMWTSADGGKVFVDGVDITALTPTEPLILEIKHLGYESNTGAFQGKATVKELMVWDRGLTGIERTGVDGYLTCKWVTSGCNTNEYTC